MDRECTSLVHWCFWDNHKQKKHNTLVCSVRITSFYYSTMPCNSEWILFKMSSLVGFNIFSDSWCMHTNKDKSVLISWSESWIKNTNYDKELKKCILYYPVWMKAKKKTNKLLAISNIFTFFVSLFFVSFCNETLNTFFIYGYNY